MAIDAQKMMMVRAEEILKEAGLSKYHWPGKTSCRGFFIANPGDEKDHSFLDNVSRAIGRNAREEGIVVYPMGFGNLDNEFPDAQAEAKKYMDAFLRKDINSIYLEHYSSIDVVGRWVFIFVPC